MALSSPSIPRLLSSVDFREVGTNPLQAPIEFGTATVRHMCLEAQEHEAENALELRVAQVSPVTVVAKLLIAM